MAYLLSDGGSNVVTYPYTIGMLRRDNPNVSFPSSPSEAVLNEWNVYTVQTTATPTIDPYTQSVTEGTPTTSDGGLTWTQTWIVNELDANTQATTYEQFATQAQLTAERLLDEADQYVVTALVRGEALTTEFESYRASIVDYQSLPGYPAATEFPVLPSSIFDTTSSEPYVAPGIEDHIQKYHSLDQAQGAAPDPYRGFNAYVNQFYLDDAGSMNQIFIYKPTSTNTITGVDVNATDTDEDTFTLTGTEGLGRVAIVNLYGSNITLPIPQNEIQAFFEAFVDNVMFGGGSTEIATAAEYKTNFYASTSALRATLTAGSLYSGFEFFITVAPEGVATSYQNVPFTQITGTDFPGVNFSIKYEGTGYAMDGYGFGPGDPPLGAQYLILGTDLGGTSPENDCTVTWDGTYFVASGSSLGSYGFPAQNINDGGPDFYDTGNEIVTNLSGTTAIPYAGGDPAIGDATNFGVGSEYVVTYEDSIFSVFVDDTTATSIGYQGGTGWDGDGSKSSYQLISAADLIKTATTFNSNGWEINSESGRLIFSYNGTPRIFFEGDGTINAVGDVNSYI